MTIGDAAKTSGVQAKMTRYYESLGLIPKRVRNNSGYRYYAVTDIHTLRFIRRGRDLGFSIDAIMRLLALWRDQNRASADVKRIALDHAAGLRTKIADLQAMLGSIKHLADHCQVIIGQIVRSWVISRIMPSALDMMDEIRLPATTKSPNGVAYPNDLFTRPWGMSMMKLLFNPTVPTFSAQV